MRTAEIEALLRKLEESGEWTGEELLRIRDLLDVPVIALGLEDERDLEGLMGRDPGYMPEGTEGWMEEDWLPRSYDKPRRAPPNPDGLHYDEERLREIGREMRAGQEVELSLTPRPAEVEAAKPWEHDPDHEQRIRTLEAALTDAFRRLKALEERYVDPSA